MHIGAGKSPETVVADFEALVARVRRSLPDLPVYFITIKPSRARWESWSRMADVNARIAKIAAHDAGLTVLDIGAPMLALGGDEAPPAHLFWIDGLHLTDEGYALWTETIRPQLLADLGPQRSTE